MPTLIFEAWINSNDPTDPGHLTIVEFDEDAGTRRHYEYEMSQAGEEKNQAAVVQKFPDTPFKYYNAMTGQSQTSTFKPLLCSQRSDAIHYEHQLGKTRQARPRFTHVRILRIPVTDDQVIELRKFIALRIAFGRYAFVREASKMNPFATRCLSALEDFAKMVKIGTCVGNAESVLIDFHRKYIQKFGDRASRLSWRKPLVRQKGRFPYAAD